MKNKAYRLLFNVINRIRIGLEPSFEFEALDKLGVSYRVQNIAINAASINKHYAHTIVTSLVKHPKLFRGKK